MRWQFYRFFFLPALALMLMVMVPVARAEEELVITPEVKEILDDYLKERIPAAFAVSRDGTRARYIYCSSPCNATGPIHQRDALQYCGKDCVILAVGKEMKLAYRVEQSKTPTRESMPVCEPGSLGADFPAGNPELRLPPEICSGYRAYMANEHFKAYATTDIMGSATTWGRSWGYRDVEEAISNALGQCRASRKRDSIPSECRLFALGDIVVYDLSEAELRAATELYKKNKNTTNADMPAD